jgi:hypothetical protein
LHGYLVYKILSPIAIIVTGYDGFRIWKTRKIRKGKVFFVLA